MFFSATATQGLFASSLPIASTLPIGSTLPTFFNLVPLIVLIPVLGLLINILFGSRLTEKAIGAIASTACGLSFLVSVLLAISLVSHPEGMIIPVADWIKIGDLDVSWAFQVDTLSVVMMLVVSGVGALIHIYSIGYMHEDVRFNGDPKRFRRFFVYLNLFIAAMMILVGSNNYLMLFVGWEGVGLCSYLLIGFWFEKGKDGIGNAIAAKKAMVTNRIGDFGFLIAIFIMFWIFGSLDFRTVFEQAPEMAKLFPAAVMAITLFMLLGVAGKSAQIPLFVWLPDAMAGPTPVSALIHAATMVTAGVYLVARSYPIYVTVPQAQSIVAVVGSVTALFAATIAIGQFDIKRVLAYSTISQLGFMVAAVGMGAVVAGMFHLVTHAFFKALLFLASGSVILGVEHGHHHVEHDQHLKNKLKQGSHDASLQYSAVFDPQDMRNMGGLRKRMKTTFWVYLIGAAALAGIPPLAGFWSKDEILASSNSFHTTAFILLTITAFLTAFYMGRQVLMVFFGKSRSLAAEHARENPPLITVPLIILAVLSAIGGLINLPFLHSLTLWLEHTLEGLHEIKFVLGIAIMSTLLALLGVGLCWWIYGRRYQEQQNLPVARRPDDPLRSILGPIFTALNQKWWIDELYWTILLNPYIVVSRFLADVIDWRFWHDWFHNQVILVGYNLLTRLLSVKIDLGVIDAIANGLGTLTQRLAGSMRRLQSGYVRNYALAVFLGVIVIIGYLILR
jgi:NADH-quinone oxidoreductase subunit L